MESRHFRGRPLDQQDVLIATQGLDIRFAPLNQENITRFQIHLGHPGADHLGAALNAHHDAMVFVAEPDLHEVLPDKA